MAAAAGRSHITKAKCHFFKNDNFNQVLTELPSAGMIAKTKGERSCSGSPRGLPGACRPLHMLCTRPQMHGTARAPECPAQVLPPPPLPRRRHLAGRSPLLLLGRRGSCPVLPALHRSRHHCGAGMPDGGQAGGAAGGGRDLRTHRPDGEGLATRAAGGAQPLAASAAAPLPDWCQECSLPPAGRIPPAHRTLWPLIAAMTGAGRPVRHMHAQECTTLPCIISQRARAPHLTACMFLCMVQGLPAPIARALSTTLPPRCARCPGCSPTAAACGPNVPASVAGQAYAGP